MTAAKAKNEPTNGSSKNLLSKLLAVYHSLPGGAFLFAAVPLLILGYFGWYFWGAEHLDRTLYSLKQENISITPQPPWIRASILGEVYRNGSLSQVSLLDPQATATIAHAFSAHTWVQRASRVRKMGDGKVQVDLVYREPAAMVYFNAQSTGRRSADNNSHLPPDGFFPVDSDGIILPPEDFVDKQVLDFFRIYATGATPAGDVGMPFGDSRVSEALELCKLLRLKREAWQVERVHVTPDDQVGQRSPWILNLVTGDNREIIWGHAPGKESTGEPSVQDKVTRLESWLSSVPTNNSVNSLDLRIRSPLSNRFTGRASIPNP